MAQNFLNKWSLYRIDGIYSPFQDYDQFTIIADGISVEKGGKYGLLDLQGDAALLQTEYKQISGKNKFLNFPLWEVRNFDLNEVTKVKADSIGFDADILTAYFNGSKERLVDRSSNEFIRSDQKSNAKTDGFTITHLERSNKWSVVNTEGDSLLLKKIQFITMLPFLYIIEGEMGDL